MTVIVIFQTIRHSFIRQTPDFVHVYVSSNQKYLLCNLYTVLLGREYIYFYNDNLMATKPFLISTTALKRSKFRTALIPPKAQSEMDSFLIDFFWCLLVLHLSSD